MDYFINEGYPETARQFADEANLRKPLGAAENIEERVQIRNAILRGDIKTAIEFINELDPEVLDLDSSLHFALLRLQLIELIRPCTVSSDADIAPALEFAQTSLAPRAPTNAKFLEDLERTMALLIFPIDSNLPAQLQGLLDPELRQEVATRVNEAVLRRGGFRGQPHLLHLIKMRGWAEKRAREAGQDLPKLDIWSDARNSGAVNEDTIMNDHDMDEPVMA